jgi:FkbM family methyltransferase
VRAQSLGAGLVMLACLGGAACGPAPRGSCAVPRGPAYDLRGHVPEGLIQAANRGRTILRADGCFSFPPGVKRVWVDVGAHYLETTRRQVDWESDVGVIAIEPLSECWPKWPATERLIGMPVAIDRERGWVDFNVNASDATSSILKSRSDSSVAALTRTVEVRRVPVLRLEDVLSRVPADLEITYLKVDVQGLELRVLQSAGDELRRVYAVRTEILELAAYEADGTGHLPTRAEIEGFMAGMGFRFVKDVEVHEGWRDKAYVNTGCWGWLDRMRHRQRYGY